LYPAFFKFLPFLYHQDVGYLDEVTDEARHMC